MESPAIQDSTQTQMTGLANHAAHGARTRPALKIRGKPSQGASVMEELPIVKRAEGNQAEKPLRARSGLRLLCRGTSAGLALAPVAGKVSQKRPIVSAAGGTTMVFTADGASVDFAGWFS